MHPLLRPNDVVLVDRFARRVRRGDVVLLHPRQATEPSLIKLVAGLGGEHVAIRSDLLWVDGVATSWGRPMIGSLPLEVQLAPDELFVLSLNLALGTDSRTLGPINRRRVRGIVREIVEPLRRRTTVARVAIRPVDPPGGADRDVSAGSAGS